VASGEWNSMVRGTNIKTTNGGTQLTVDVEGLTPTTKYYFTIIAEDNNINKFQYGILTTITASE
jgi:phosphodiesterase/alkaline phosphatase D-like protein